MKKISFTLAIGILAMAFVTSGCGDKEDGVAATAPGETKTATEIPGGKVRGSSPTGGKTRSSERRSD